MFFKKINIFNYLAKRDWTTPSQTAKGLNLGLT